MVYQYRLLPRSCFGTISAILLILSAVLNCDARQNDHDQEHTSELFEGDLPPPIENIGFSEGIREYDPMFLAPEPQSFAHNDPQHKSIYSLEKRVFVGGLINNQMSNLDIEFGGIQTWTFSTQQLFSNPTNNTPSERASGGPRVRTVYFTINTCQQPLANATLTSLPPPQLTVYISNSTVNQNPGPHVDKAQIVVPMVEGFANATLNATGTLYISVVAPNTTKKETGFWMDVYNYQIAGSTIEPQAGYEDSRELYLIDSDSANALLITGNMTNIPSNTNLTNYIAPYTIFANPSNMTNMVGLTRSFCGMRNAMMNRQNAEISMTRRGLGGIAKEQFYLKGLNASSTYNVWLAKANNGTLGGWVYPALNVTTKTDGNCRVIYDLEFCSEVAYAVPSNDTIFPSKSLLARFYDTYSHSWYANFSDSLQQIACNTSLTSAYSLARNCDDCAAAYKTWLCAVTIPRCADYSSNATYLAPRALNQSDGPTLVFLDNGTLVDKPGVNLSDGDNDEINDNSDVAPGFNGSISDSSRNILIDMVVSPGPYKEIQPCIDLCWTLVQSCPSSFGFACPRGKTAYDSYGDRSPDGDVTCSWLGAVYFLSDGGRRMVSGGSSGGLLLLWLMSGGVVLLIELMLL